METIKQQAKLSQRVLSFAQIEQPEPGVFSLRFLSGCVLRLDDAQELIRLVELNSGGKKSRILFHLRPDVHITENARRFLTSRTASDYIETAAVILSPRFSRLSLWFSLKLNQPNFPVKLFSNRRTAFSWLTSLG